MKAERAEIVKSGFWDYGEAVEYEVWIVKQNFEYHYEEGFDEAERLNSAGEVFAVIYAQEGQRIGSVEDFVTLNEAVTAAERAIPQGIRWDNHRLQPLFGGREYRLQPDS